MVGADIHQTVEFVDALDDVLSTLDLDEGPGSDEAIYVDKELYEVDKVDAVARAVNLEIVFDDQYSPHCDAKNEQQEDGTHLFLCPVVLIDVVLSHEVGVVEEKKNEH